MITEIKLIKKTYSANAIGDQIATETKRTVFAELSSVSEREFFDAGQNGLKPDRKFTVKTCEYEHEDALEYNSQQYSIYRTYERGDGRVELYTERRVGNE